MADVSINGFSVVEARLLVSRLGAWVAEVVVDALTAASFPDGAACTLKLAGGAISYVGTKFRGDVYAQTVTLKVVGGPNGLAKPCRPRFYNGAPISTVLGDLMRDGGSQLSGASSAGALGVVLPFWTMLEQDVSLALSSLAEAGPEGTVWRILKDGNVFFGVDVWTPSALTDFQLLDFLPQEGFQVIAAETPNVYPGELFNGFRVSACEHTITPDGSRVRVWSEAA